MPTLDSDPANGLDNYDVADLSDDPFASPPPEASNKKRKEPDSGLGIDEEVDVKKRARAPNVKLDEERFVDTCISSAVQTILIKATGSLALKEYPN
jgi:replication fork protection complex subunit Csm3/Swi3